MKQGSDPDQRRFFVARGRREVGTRHVVAASELVLSDQSRGGHHIAACRKWLGLAPWPERACPPRGARTGTGREDREPE